MTSLLWASPAVNPAGPAHAMVAATAQCTCTWQWFGSARVVRSSSPGRGKRGANAEQHERCGGSPTKSVDGKAEKWWCGSIQSTTAVLRCSMAVGGGSCSTGGRGGRWGTVESSMGVARGLSSPERGSWRQLEIWQSGLWNTAVKWTNSTVERRGR
jgi:hypothetical protein